MPKNNESYFEIVRDVRPNKGTILKSSVDYIKCLKHEINRLKKNEQRQKEMEYQNKRLVMRIQELELQAKQHGYTMADNNKNYGLTVPDNNYVKTPSPTTHNQLMSDIGKVSLSLKN